MCICATELLWNHWVRRGWDGGLSTGLHNRNILQEFRGEIQIKHTLTAHTKRQCTFSFTPLTWVSALGIHLKFNLLSFANLYSCIQSSSGQKLRVQSPVHSLFVWKEDLGQQWDAQPVAGTGPERRSLQCHQGQGLSCRPKDICREHCGDREWWNEDVL